MGFAGRIERQEGEWEGEIFSRELENRGEFKERYMVERKRQGEKRRARGMGWGLEGDGGNDDGKKDDGNGDNGLLQVKS